MGNHRPLTTVVGLLLCCVVAVVVDGVLVTVVPDAEVQEAVNRLRVDVGVDYQHYLPPLYLRCLNASTNETKQWLEASTAFFEESFLIQSLSRFTKDSALYSNVQNPPVLIEVEESEARSHGVVRNWSAPFTHGDVVTQPVTAEGTNNATTATTTETPTSVDAAATLPFSTLRSVRLFENSVAEDLSRIITSNGSTNAIAWEEARDASLKVWCEMAPLEPFTHSAASAQPDHLNSAFHTFQENRPRRSIAALGLYGNYTRIYFHFHCTVDLSSASLLSSTAINDLRAAIPTNITDPVAVANGASAAIGAALGTATNISTAHAFLLGGSADADVSSYDAAIEKGAGGDCTMTSSSPNRTVRSTAGSRGAPYERLVLHHLTTVPSTTTSFVARRLHRPIVFLDQMDGVGPAWGASDIASTTTNVYTRIRQDIVAYINSELARVLSNGRGTFTPVVPNDLEIVAFAPPNGVDITGAALAQRAGATLVLYADTEAELAKRSNILGGKRFTLVRTGMALQSAIASARATPVDLFIPRTATEQLVEAQSQESVSQAATRNRCTSLTCVISVTYWILALFFVIIACLIAFTGVKETDEEKKLAAEKEVVADGARTSGDPRYQQQQGASHHHHDMSVFSHRDGGRGIAAPPTKLNRQQQQQQGLQRSSSSTYQVAPRATQPYQAKTLPPPPSPQRGTQYEERREPTYVRPTDQSSARPYRGNNSTNTNNRDVSGTYQRNGTGPLAPNASNNKSSKQRTTNISQQQQRRRREDEQLQHQAQQQPSGIVETPQESMMTTGAFHRNVSPSPTAAAVASSQRQQHKPLPRKRDQAGGGGSNNNSDPSLHRTTYHQQQQPPYEAQDTLVITQTFPTAHGGGGGAMDDDVGHPGEEGDDNDQQEEGY